MPLGHDLDSGFNIDFQYGSSVVEVGVEWDNMVQAQGLPVFQFGPLVGKAGVDEVTLSRLRISFQLGSLADGVYGDLTWTQDLTQKLCSLVVGVGVDGIT